MSKEIEVLKKPNQLEKFTAYQKEEYLKCMLDPLYFIENYMMIQHPMHGQIPFKPYEFQKNMIRAFHKNRFNVACTGRQQGKSFTLNTIITHNDEEVQISSLMKFSFKEKVVNFLERLLLKLSV